MRTCPRPDSCSRLSVFHPCTHPVPGDDGERASKIRHGGNASIQPVLWMDHRRCRIRSSDDIVRHHLFDAGAIPLPRSRLRHRPRPGAFIFSFSQVMAFVIGPIAGSLAERRGPRLVVGGGIILMAAGLLGAKKPSRRRRHTRKLSSEIPPCTSAVRVGTLLARAVVAEERLDGAHAADKEGLAALIELIEANTRSH